MGPKDQKRLEFMNAGRRGRQLTLIGGKGVSFRLDSRHRYAIRTYRIRNGLKTDTEALQSILDVVADSEGLPENVVDCISLFDTDPEKVLALPRELENAG